MNVKTSKYVILLKWKRFLQFAIVDASFTFLAICLVGTENKATLSRKVDMRLQLRSFAWHRVMVRWTHRDEDKVMWEWMNGNGWVATEPFMNSDECNGSEEPQAEIMSLKHNRYALLSSSERKNCVDLKF